MDIQQIDQELDRELRQGAARDIVIPPCPQLLIRLKAVMDGPDPDPADVCAIAGADVALSAGLLKTANSPLFARSRPASTVSQAVAKLGMRLSASILAEFMVRDAIRINSPLLEQFWETSSWRALATAHIAKVLYQVDPDKAHTFGLFCHVGIPIMMRSIKGYEGTLIEAQARQDRSFTDIENAAHRADHAVVGALVSRTWLLPQTITIAVRLHHDFTCLKDQRVPPEVRALVAMGLVAEHLVQSHIGLAESMEWKQHGPACLQSLNVDPSELEYWADQLHDVFASAAV